MNQTRWRPIGLVLLSSASLQAGLAVASTAFVAAGPIAAVWVRSVVGAVLLWLYIRPDPRSYTRDRVGPITAYGVALACLTGCAYIAIANAPLGLVSAILMLGPLAIAAWGNRTPVDLALVGIAAVGTLLLCLANGTQGPVNAVGLGFAFAGAVALGAYIVAGKRVNSGGQGLSGLALALVITAALQTPFGLLLARDGLWDASVLATLALAGVLATLVPFTLEAVALRTLPMATFGLVLAFEPAVAALVGLVIRGDSLVGAAVGRDRTHRGRGSRQSGTERMDASHGTREQRDHGRSHRGRARPRPAVRGAVPRRPRDARDGDEHPVDRRGHGAHPRG